MTFNFVVEGVLLLLVACLGLAGNLASYVILMRQKVQKIFHNLLFLLTTLDTVSRLVLLHHVSMSPCHHVTMSPCLHVTMSPCHHVTMSPCLHVISKINLLDLPPVRHHSLCSPKYQSSLCRLLPPPHPALHAACGSYWNGDMIIISRPEWSTLIGQQHLDPSSSESRTSSVLHSDLAGTVQSLASTCP